MNLACQTAAHHKRTVLMDIVAMLITFVFFGLCIAYAELCDRL